MILKLSRLFFCLWVCLLLTPLSGQEADEVVADDNPPFYDNAIRASLISWLDPSTASARIGFDHRISNRSLLKYEVGYYYRFPSGESSPGLLDLNGFSGHTSLRLWTAGPLSRSNAGTKNFFDFSLMYRYLDAEIAGDFNRDNFSFSQRINYSVTENSLGLSVSVGRVIILSNHLWLELSMGVGGIVSAQNFSEIPGDASFITNEGLNRWRYRRDQERAFATLTLPLGFSLLYYW
ncbi:hypothetical protein CEQ90_16240 [Lewinellaceae bacterium SD302]|nr:hypothetical protein CEQ90_16240 [Lewinellaceae bacterium SD302]